jgi:hypothetical protein
MARYKRITKEMIRGYFGSSARIRATGFGVWRVTTPTGGEVIITQQKIRFISGGDDVYQACTLLIGEAWGSCTAGPGSREFMLGMAAHGEAWGVPVRPDYTKPGAGAKRFLVAFLIVIAALKIGIAQTDEGMFLTLVFAAIVCFAMRSSSRQQARKEAEQMGFHYPRVHGQGRGAAREDAARKGRL